MVLVAVVAQLEWGVEQRLQAEYVEVAMEGVEFHHQYQEMFNIMVLVEVVEFTILIRLGLVMAEPAGRVLAEQEQTHHIQLEVSQEVMQSQILVLVAAELVVRAEPHQEGVAMVAQE